MSEKRLTVRDIVTVAIMIALFFALSIVVGMGTVTMPILYLYGTAGIEMFIGAIFYLVAANRVNKPVSYTHLDVYKRQHLYLVQ